MSRLRDLTEYLAQEFEGAVREAEFVAGGRKGQIVPVHGDFAGAARMPGLVGRMRWWARELRAALDEEVKP
jgi:hypothetical protein